MDKVFIQRAYNNSLFTYCTVFREALLDNIQTRGALEVNRFIETIPDSERKNLLFPSSSDNDDNDQTTSSDFFVLHEACAANKYETFTGLVSYGKQYGIDMTVPNDEVCVRKRLLKSFLN